jgi:hypothetical protein
MSGPWDVSLIASPSFNVIRRTFACIAMLGTPASRGHAETQAKTQAK